MTKKIVTRNVVTMNPVEICRALGDPIRWRIIRLVSHEALCVCELADILGMPQSSVSSHVQIIRKAGLLESEKCEKWTYFRVQAQFLKLLRDLEAHTATSDPAWAADDRNTVKRLTARENSCCPRPKHLFKPRRSSASLP
jgi:ArsR family transcriptional regulator, arsenate/arsenite/antimonite-responsive transcriptional repressor